MKNRLLDYRKDHAPPDEPLSPEGQDESWIGRQWATASRRIEQCMGKYPAATVAVGLSVGVFIGWMIKRR